jgi:hypothetical protein
MKMKMKMKIEMVKMRMEIVDRVSRTPQSIRSSILAEYSPILMTYNHLKFCNLVGG